MENLNHLRVTYFHFLDLAAGVVTKAIGENRALTAAERAEVEAHRAEAQRLKARIDEGQATLQHVMRDTSREGWRPGWGVLNP